MIKATVVDATRILAKEEAMKVDVLRDIDEVEDQPTENHAFLCLACFCWEGRVRWTCGRLCRKHAQKFNWYRRKRGLPPLPPWKKIRVDQGERTRSAILEALTKRATSTKGLAATLGLTRDGALYQMHRLEAMEKVVRVKNAHTVVWGLAETI